MFPLVALLWICTFRFSNRSLLLSTHLTSTGCSGPTVIVIDTVLSRPWLRALFSLRLLFFGRLLGSGLRHLRRQNNASFDRSRLSNSPMRPARAASPASRGGWALYELYRAASRAAAPGVLLWRRLQGLEHPTRWPERLGRPSAARPRPGSPLVWFHAVSLGEGMAALPVVRHCVRLHPDLPVLLTTTTLSSL